MKKTLLILILLMPGLALAQDVARADEKPAPKVEKALPPKVTIPAAQVQTLTAASRDAENATLRVQNLELQIEKATRQLQEMKDAAKKLSDAAKEKSGAAFEAAGIPRDKLEQYEIKENSDGSLDLLLKVTPSSSAAKKTQ
jgi:hypothetical protein